MRAALTEPEENMSGRAMAGGVYIENCPEPRKGLRLGIAYERVASSGHGNVLEYRRERIRNSKEVQTRQQTKMLLK